MSTQTQIPKLFEHCVNLYHVLRATAVKDEDSKVEVFTGSVVDAYKSIGSSMGNYTPIFNLLYEMGCIEKLRQGRAGQPSIIALHHPPVLSEFESTYKKALTAPTPAGIIEQRLTNLERRLDGVDLKSALVNFEGRLAQVEQQLRERNGKKS